MRWILHITMLGMCSVEDRREKMVSVWKIMLYGIVVLGYEVWKMAAMGNSLDMQMKKMAAGILPGIFLVLLSKVSREAVGYADGLLVLIIGMSMGLYVTMGIFLAALLGIFGTSAVVFLCCRKTRKYQIAFVPYLFLAMAGAGLWMDL